MIKEKVFPIIGVALVVGTVGFFIGSKFGSGSRPASMQGDFQNLTAEQRQQRLQQFGGGVSGGRQMGSDGGSISGEILSKDEKGVTVKLPDGGSKIVFFSDKTQIMKSTAGSISDVVVGGQVTVNGSSNSDGSVTAQSIQIRDRLINP